MGGGGAYYWNFMVSEMRALIIIEKENMQDTLADVMKFLRAK